MANVGRPLQFPERFLVQLTTEQRATLRWLAEMTGKSQSEWVRWFIDQGTGVFGLMREMEEITCPTPNGYKESSSK
jgi:hypothetical protein